MSADKAIHPIVVRGTEILAGDPPRIRLQKIARVTLDSMVQFVGLLDPQGTVLEINKVALDAVGIKLPDVEGKPFWTTFWWQVSEEINTALRESIARAANGEFVRWDTPIYGRAGGKETIIIDASLCPVLDDDGNVVFLCAEGAISPRKRRKNGKSPRRTSSCRDCSNGSANSTKSRRSSSPTSVTSCARRWP